MAFRHGHRHHVHTYNRDIRMSSRMDDTVPSTTRFSLGLAALVCDTASSGILPTLSNSANCCVSNSIFWTAVFGRFGALYIHEPRDEGTMRMKDTVWVDLVNMLLWVWTAAVSTWEFRYGGQWCVFSDEMYMVDEEAQRRK